MVVCVWRIYMGSRFNSHKKFIFVYKNQICDILYRYIFGENYLITDYISTILLLLDLKGNFLLRWDMLFNFGKIMIGTHYHFGEKVFINDIMKWNISISLVHSLLNKWIYIYLFIQFTSYDW